MDLGVRDSGFVIFGGTRGIGLATASALAAEGAYVALVGRDAQRAEEMAVSLQGSHPAARVIGLPCDLNMKGEAERIVALAREEFGGLRGMAVTTGLGHRGQRTIFDADDTDWEHTFTDIFLGTVHACRAVLPVLVEERRWGDRYNWRLFRSCTEVLPGSIHVHEGSCSQPD